MTHTSRGWLMLLIAFASGCRPADGNPPPDPNQRTVEEAAVAGLFYPGDAQELGATIDKLLAAAPTVPVGKLRGLVCPHAGYEYSGPTAAYGYKQLAGRSFTTVIVLAPSHYAEFRGAAVSTAAAHATPLGQIPVSPRAAELAQRPPFCAQPDCTVQRPPWARHSPKQAPPRGQETPHTWEHSLEVQLPFLQKTLTDFRLVPVIVGRADAAQAAAALDPLVDDQTLIVASSDLSHYHPYDEAQQRDASCVRAICDLDVQWMDSEEACGKGPILTLMHLARKKGWHTKLLDYRNSGDTSGDRSGVVGYTAIAFYEGEAPGAADADARRGLQAEEQQFLLTLARQTLAAAVGQGGEPEVDAGQVPESLRSLGACFVTLTKSDQLRGCIGHIFACRPLYQAVIENATNAALNDPRFPPVKAAELDELDVEISVLTMPRRLAFASPEELLAKLRPGIDGVVFALRGRRATYLPQVWEHLADKERFLRELAKKARLSEDAWKDPAAAVLTYQVQAFHGKYHE